MNEYGWKKFSTVYIMNLISFVFFSMAKVMFCILFLDVLYEILFLDLLEDCKLLQAISASSISGTIYFSLEHKEEKWGHSSHEIEDLIVRVCWRWASITLILTVNDRTTGNLIRRTMHKVMDITEGERTGKVFWMTPKWLPCFYVQGLTM